MTLDFVYQCDDCKGWYWFHLDEDIQWGDYTAHDRPLSRDEAFAMRLHYPGANSVAHCPVCRPTKITRAKTAGGEFLLREVAPPEKGKTTFYSALRRA
jgi:hypothetical protein